LTATRLIRSELGLTGLPIIAFTAGVLAEQQQAARAAGAHDMLAQAGGAGATGGGAVPLDPSRRRNPFLHRRVNAYRSGRPRPLPSQTAKSLLATGITLHRTQFSGQNTENAFPASLSHKIRTPMLRPRHEKSWLTATPVR